MNVFARWIAVTVAAFLFLAFGSNAVANPVRLPFLVNLAPGDIFVHDSVRSTNVSETYETHSMQMGDEVIGAIGRLRSVILTGDPSAVEVLPNSALTAEVHDGAPCLSLRAGETRVGRASNGDGSNIRTFIVTHQVGAVIDGGDLLVSRGTSHISTVRQPEEDSRYLFSGLVSIVPLVASAPSPIRNVRPSPFLAYLNSSGNGSRSSLSMRFAARRSRVRRRHHRARSEGIMQINVRTSGFKN